MDDCHTGTMYLSTPLCLEGWATSMQMDLHTSCAVLPSVGSGASHPGEPLTAGSVKRKCFIYSRKQEAHNKRILHLPFLGLPDHRCSKLTLPALQQGHQDAGQPWLLPGPNTSGHPHHCV